MHRPHGQGYVDVLSRQCQTALFLLQIGRGSGLFAKAKDTFLVDDHHVVDHSFLVEIYLVEGQVRVHLGDAVQIGRIFYPSLFSPSSFAFWKNKSPNPGCHGHLEIRLLILALATQQLRYVGIIRICQCIALAGMPLQSFI